MFSNLTGKSMLHFKNIHGTISQSQLPKSLYATMNGLVGGTISAASLTGTVSLTNLPDYPAARLTSLQSAISTMAVAEITGTISTTQVSGLNTVVSTILASITASSFSGTVSSAQVIGFGAAVGSLTAASISGSLSTAKLYGTYPFASITGAGSLALLNTIPVASVTGLGSLAILNTIPTSSVTGTFATASLTGTFPFASVSGAGWLAGQNTIPAASITGLPGISYSSMTATSLTATYGSLTNIMSTSNTITGNLDVKGEIHNTAGKVKLIGAQGQLLALDSSAADNAVCVLQPNGALNNVASTLYFAVNNNGSQSGSPNQLNMGVTGPSFGATAFIDTANGGVAAATPLSIRTQGTERMWFNAAGNAGLTTSLDVAGSITASGQIKQNSGTAQPGIEIKGSANDVFLRLNNTKSAGKSYILGSGAVGSGYPAAFYVYDETAGKSRFVINTSGNVGIGPAFADGTLGPAAELDVNGFSRLSYGYNSKQLLLAPNYYYYSAWNYRQIAKLGTINDSGNGHALHLTGVMGPFGNSATVDIVVTTRNGLNVRSLINGALNSSIVDIFVYAESNGQYTVYIKVNGFINYALTADYSGSGWISTTPGAETTTAPSGGSVAWLASANSKFVLNGDGTVYGPLSVTGTLSGPNATFMSVNGTDIFSGGDASQDNSAQLSVRSLNLPNGLNQQSVLRIGAYNSVSDLGCGFIQTVTPFYGCGPLMLQPRGGSVGIGMGTNPAYKLDVNGTVNATNYRIPGVDGDMLDNYYGSATDRYGLNLTGGVLRLYSSGNFFNGKIALSLATGVNTFTDYLTMQHNGTVNIPYASIGTLTVSAGPSVWTSVSLQNNFTSSTDTPLKCTLYCGRVYLRGDVVRNATAHASNSAGAYVATIPSGFRPAYSGWYPISQIQNYSTPNGISYMARISTDGQIFFSAGLLDDLVFDGISFFPA